MSVAFFGLAAAGDAHAKCAAPGVTFAPSAGVTAGTSWVFAPSYRDVAIVVQVDNPAGLESEIVKVSDNGSFAAYRVVVSPVAQTARRRGAPSYTVVVSNDYGNSDRATYQLSSQTAAAPAGLVDLVDASYEKSAWTCSHTDAVRATPSIEAVAYRLEWSRTETDYRAGVREVVVVPASMAAFWGDRGEPAIELGHLNCFGETIPSTALADTAYVGIVPLGHWAEPAAPADPLAITSPSTADGAPTIVRVTRTADDGDVAPVEPEPIEYRCGYAVSHDLERQRRRDEAPPLGLLWALFTALVALPLSVLGVRRLTPATAAHLDAASAPQLLLVASALALAGPVWLAAIAGFTIVIAAGLCGALLRR